MKLTLVYRPERETPSRSGSRFIYNTLITPGYNSFDNDRQVADLEKYLETEEGKEQVRKTIFDEVTSDKKVSEPEVVKPISETTVKKTRTPKSE